MAKTSAKFRKFPKLSDCIFMYLSASQCTQMDPNMSEPVWTTPNTSENFEKRLKTPEKRLKTCENMPTRQTKGETFPNSRTLLKHFRTHPKTCQRIRMYLKNLKIQYTPQVRKNVSINWDARSENQSISKNYMDCQKFRKLRVSLSGSQYHSIIAS